MAERPYFHPRINAHAVGSKVLSDWANEDLIYPSPIQMVNCPRMGESTSPDNHDRAYLWCAQTKLVLVHFVAFAGGELLR
jgi:hypothetical protein